MTKNTEEEELTVESLAEELLDIYHCNGRIAIWPKNDVEYFILRAVHLAELALSEKGVKYE